MEITFGVSKNPYTNELTETLLTEERANNYLEKLKLVHKMVKNKTEEEKQRRTEKLNISREKNIDIPDNPYLRTTFHKKNKPKYFKVTYDKTKKTAKNPNLNPRHSFKIHPNRIKRPRRQIKQKDPLVSAQDAHSPIPGPSGLAQDD